MDKEILRIHLAKAKEHNVSQYEIAKQIGVCKEEIYGWRKGRHGISKKSQSLLNHFFEIKRIPTITEVIYSKKKPIDSE